MESDNFFEKCFRMRFEKVGGTDSTMGMWSLLTDEPPVYEHLHIEFSPKYWFPLNKVGALPTADVAGPLGDIGFITKNGGTLGKHWTEFPDDTRLGWRGPMMREADLRVCPLVFKRDNDDDDDVAMV